MSSLIIPCDRLITSGIRQVDSTGFFDLAETVFVSSLALDASEMAWSDCVQPEHPQGFGEGRPNVDLSDDLAPSRKHGIGTLKGGG